MFFQCNNNEVALTEAKFQKKEAQKHLANAELFQKKNEALIEKEIKKSIQAFEDKAIEVINSIQSFNWIDFEKGYLANRSAKSYVKDAFDERIKERFI